MHAGCPEATMATMDEAEKHEAAEALETAENMTPLRKITLKVTFTSQQKSQMVP